MSADQHYATALSDLCSGYAALRPPKRVSVSEGAGENLVIRQTGAAGGAWSVEETPYMAEPMDMLASRRHEAEVFVGPARTGKCLDITTPVPTPLGWSTMGELTAGNVVFSDTGAPTTVLLAHEVKHGLPCYEVQFSDGSTLIADSEHLWGVERFYWREPKWRYEVRSTESLINDFRYSPRADGGARYRYRVRNAAPLECPEQPVLMDPYLLGVWLGNGTSTCSVISSHNDDVAHYEEAIRRAGHTVVSTPDGPNTAWTRIDHIDHDSGDVFGRFQWRLKHLGLLGNKHIPAAYLRGSRAQRLALLQGLMDTDGYPGNETHSAVEFSTVNPVLCENFCELARSLGVKPIATLKETTWVYQGVRKHGTAYRVTFSTPDGLDVFTLPRKLGNAHASTVDIGYRQIVDIRPVPSRPVRCIQVDAPSSLFLAGKGMVPTHNTSGLLLGWLAHTVVNDPGDMLFVQMSKDKAREFSKTDVTRAIKNSPKVKAMRSNRAIDSNTFDTMFRNGVWMRVAWPTVSNVSGSTYRYVAITDLDRIENADNVDGEGPLFDLARKRTTTFLSRGMCLAESSPGLPIIDPAWRPATPHEAPPVKGILGIYNRSDRRRWYWQCTDCREWFEAKPGLSLFNLPPDEELLERVRGADIPAMAAEYGSRIVCPCCGVLIPAKAKVGLNRRGRWVAEGQRIDSDGGMHGAPATSTIAGYWLGGVAATYQSWPSLVERYLQGLRDYALTGSEETLKTTINTDQGMPYMSRHLVEGQGAHSSSLERAERGRERFVCPAETRTIVVSVDVQGGVNSRFIAQAHAVGPYMEQWCIDRFEIKTSTRAGTGSEFAPIDPARYPEDWDILTERILRSTYRTEVEGREMRVKMLVVDSGGEDGATANAYAWARRIRRDGLTARVRLYKGSSSKTAPVVKETLVGNRSGQEKGDIKLLMCNPNLLSDAVDAGLKRATPGPGYIHFPAVKHPTLNPDGWVNQAFFDELTAEVRDKDGTWRQIKKRNETFDLCRMIRVGMLALGLDKIRDWDVVPDWLKPVEFNSETVSREERRELKANEPKPVYREARPRRMATSPYLR